MEHKDTLGEKFARLVTSNIPGKGVTAIVYYNGEKLKNSGNVDKLKEKLQNQLAKLDDLSQYELVNLGTDLSVFFIADREFRNGQVVDNYWKVFERCNDANKKVLSGISGW